MVVTEDFIQFGSEKVKMMSNPLSVEITVKSMKLRCCVAYGFQKSELIEKKHAFWAYLDEEVVRANDSGSGFILHMDGNLWAGADIVPGDPRNQNRNGKLFAEFLKINL